MKLPSLKQLHGSSQSLSDVAYPANKVSQMIMAALEASI